MLGKLCRRTTAAPVLLLRPLSSLASLSDGAATLYPPELTSESLRRLLTGEALALVVRGWYPAAECAARAAAVSNAAGARPWHVATLGGGVAESGVEADVEPLAMAAARGPEALEAYFKGSLGTMRDARRRHAGASLLPADLLRLELDECWPDGATVGKRTSPADGSIAPHIAGVGRTMRGPTADALGYVHVDELAPLSPTAGLFSANVYLQVPPVGGELHVWDTAFSRLQFYANADTLSLLATPPGDAAAQAALRAALPEPALTFAPAPGDLVILSVQRPHCVQGFPVGDRVTVQCFLDYEEGRALRLES